METMSVTAAPRGFVVSTGGLEGVQITARWSMIVDGVTSIGSFEGCSAPLIMAKRLLSERIRISF